MKIAVAQLSSAFDTDWNFELVRQYTARAATQGARVVVFPEATQRSFGYPLHEVAEPADGPWAEQVREVAHEHGIVIVLGMFTPGQPSPQGDPRVRNTLLAVGPGVDISYDKIHLYDAFGFKESDTVQPGDTPSLFEIDGLKFGLATCYDVRFPRLFEHYARQGASAVLVSASWGAGPEKVRQWRTLISARALDSTCYIAAAGQADPQASDVVTIEGAPTGVGHSAILGPTGEEIVSAAREPQLLVAEIDSTRVEAVRRVLPVLDNAVDGFQ